MLRTACALLLLSQILLVGFALRPSGPSAIWLSFVGSPALVAGLLLYLLALGRGRRARRAGPERGRTVA